MAEPVIHVSGVSFGYGDNPVIRDLSLAIEPGRFHGIVGPNGSGKTTLLDLITGYRRPQEGTVRLSGRPVTDYSRMEMARRLALVPQEYSVNFPFTVTELVAMGRHPHRGRFGGQDETDRAVVANALAALDLETMADKLITELSGGEKQRVVLARALAQDAPTLLLDEPTANLDVFHALAALRVVARRVASDPGHSLTAVAVMHDLNLAAAHCDSLIFLKNGRLAAAGPTAEVLRPETVQEVFGVAARVVTDDFTDSLRVSFRRLEDGR